MSTSDFVFIGVLCISCVPEGQKTKQMNVSWAKTLLTLRKHTHRQRGAGRERGVPNIERERECACERERDRQIDKQTGRQREREIDRQTDRQSQTDGQRDREWKREERQVKRGGESQREKEAERVTEKERQINFEWAAEDTLYKVRYGMNTFW